VVTRLRELVQAIREGDDATVEAAVHRLSRSRRWLAPLALAAGAFSMLFQGLRLVFSHWRLTLVQILPATWIWLAMLDLKLHALHGRSFHVLRGPVLVPIVLAIAAITTAAFFLNAVFAFAVARTHPPDIGTGVAGARSHLRVVLGSGAVVGLLLGLSTTVVTRWGSPWFALALGPTIAVMMVCYVAVPSTLIGLKVTRSRRDRLTASAMGAALGAAVTAPPYLLGRIGILMLGSHALFIPGIFVFALGFTLQAGATGAVTAIKTSAKLMAAQPAAARTARDGGARPDPPAAGDSATVAP